MKISQVISLLQDIQRLHGDLEVFVRRESDGDLPDNDPDLFAGFVSCTGCVYSHYDFTHFGEDYPEKEQFDLEKDKLCII
jgi:hypothetical protein